MAGVWVGWPPNAQALPEHSQVGRIPERQGTSRKHPLPDAELCLGPHGQDEELQLQVLQRSLATRDRDWALLSWLGRGYRGRKGWLGRSMEVKDQVIREGYRR